MSQPYVGEVQIFAGNYAPYGWCLCDGRMLAISEYDVLFTLIGTTYGGDGQVTFAVPDLRGRVPIGMGTGPGLTNRVIGETGGVESYKLLTSQMPSHTHELVNTLKAVSGAGNTIVPTNNYLAASRSASAANYAPTGTSNSLNSASISSAGNVTSGVTGRSTGTIEGIPVIQPYLALNFIISLYGVYPTT